MTVHLEVVELWEVVGEDYELTPIGDNPNQMKPHKENKTRKSKSKACPFLSSIHTRILQMKSVDEIWEHPEKEYHKNEIVQNIQVMNLI